MAKPTEEAGRGDQETVEREEEGSERKQIQIRREQGVGTEEPRIDKGDERNYEEMERISLRQGTTRMRRVHEVR